MPKIPSTPRVLLVTGEITGGFMRDDMRILHRRVEVVPHEHALVPAPGGRLLGRPARVVLNFLAFLYRLLRHDARVVIFWFASTHYAPAMALLARLLGRRVIVVTGGMDAVYVPEIDWGMMKSGRHRRAFGRLMRRADAVLPFSEASARTITERYRPRHLRTVYPAVDTRYFVPGPAPREERVVTCCYDYGAGNIVQKGLDGFVETARRLPGVQFVVVGNPIDEAARMLAAGAPPNVRFIPRIADRAGYRDFLAGSSVYLQLSAHEGFGVSVAEAMSCGCVPVVADRYSLPEVVGDAGFIVPFRAPEEAAAAVSRALGSPPEARERARARVEEHFGRERRAAALFEELGRLVPEIRNPPLRLELGCGSTGVAGAIGVDARRTVQTSAVCDVQHSCFRSGIADEVYSFCVLEHLDDPYLLMNEVARILKPEGRAYLRVPNLGTFSSHLDMTHRFLADLAIWREIMNAYFEKVTVVPEGTKYRDNPLLRTVNAFLVRVLRFHELTQGWTFVCERKRAVPRPSYRGWWQEPPPAG